MRPRGEVRQALTSAACALAAETGPVHWRAIAARAQVGWAVARTSIKNMVRTGELERCGTASVDWSRRPVMLLKPAEQYQVEMPLNPPANDPHHCLAAAIAGWATRG